MDNTNSKGAVLYLCNRIPYPPHRGDKIRSYHLMRRLGDVYDLHVGGFLADSADERHYQNLPQFCKSHFFVKQTSKGSFKNAALNLFSKSSMTMNLFNHGDLAEWVRTTVSQHNIKCIIVNSLPMAQYAFPYVDQDVCCLADFERVESDSWRQFEPSKGPIGKKVYQRELGEIESCENLMAEKFRGIIFSSKLNARIFRSHYESASDKVAAFSDGVETRYFSPENTYPKIFHPKEKPIVFCGAMEEAYNEDAVIWFAENIYGQIKSRIPEASFYVVGGNPSKKLVKLAESHHFVVTGEVADVRPYLAGCELAIAPVKRGKAVHYKVLESLAMGKPCVMTPHSMEALVPADWLGDLVAGSASIFAEKCIGILNGLIPYQQNFRPYIEANYSWDKLFLRYQFLLKQIL